ncbi:hypothetical protein ICC18_27825 [Paenibacillus sp. WST5]|uniref:Uncharacterized protein n=1 Tax=Paenibacillus sedimenti TaxID=2770274 RepID=A0A926QN02_9BACL|nr:hypothetical protein [Paenibacillus sedimenti]
MENHLHISGKQTAKEIQVLEAAGVAHYERERDKVDTFVVGNAVVLFLVDYARKQIFRSSRFLTRWIFQY